MRLNLILSTILQEKERIDRMLAKYQEELGRLPKGTISEKKVKQSTYFYLKYREGKKVISRYIPQRMWRQFESKWKNAGISKR